MMMLTESDNVWNYSLLLEGPPAVSESAEPSLHFICNANPSVLPHFLIHHCQIPFWELNLACTTGQTLVDEGPHSKPIFIQLLYLFLNFTSQLIIITFGVLVQVRQRSDFYVRFMVTRVSTVLVLRNWH